jgi:hypothetical protein
MAIGSNSVRDLAGDVVRLRSGLSTTAAIIEDRVPAPYALRAVPVVSARLEALVSASAREVSPNSS